MLRHMLLAVAAIFLPIGVMFYVAFNPQSSFSKFMLEVW